MKISITLPSLYPKELARAVENINATTRAAHEILVVSPFEFSGDNVMHIRESESRGCNYAQALASKFASGDLIVAHTDDFDYVDSWDDLIIPDFLEREKLYKGDYLLGLRYDIDDFVGINFGMYYANFPMMRCANLEKFGWLGQEFKIGFGDSDLSMRVWDRGGTCEFSKDKVLRQALYFDGSAIDSRRKSSTYTEKDLLLFASRWIPKYGDGWDTTRLEGYHTIVDIVKEPQVLSRSGRSIYLRIRDA
jgi:hypothetical protein